MRTGAGTGAVVVRRGRWGHNGSGIGSLCTLAAAADGSRAITVATHSRPAERDRAESQLTGLDQLTDHALCDRESHR